MQVLFQQNPLVMRGLSLPQRLMYFSTMWSYFSGFAAIVYFAAPVIFLLLGVLPVLSLAPEFFLHFLPFVVLNQTLFIVASRGLPTWRAQQYSLALFPVWIKSVTSAVRSVVFRSPLSFAVTPKVETHSERPQWGLIWPQLLAMAVLIVATVLGVIRLVWFGADPLGTGVNVFWAVFDVLILSVLIRAVQYRGYVATKEGS